MSDLLERTGPITHAEAREILSRFNASHWDSTHRDTGREKARYTIPADPKRDDNIRLAAYIDQCEAQLAAEREAVRVLRDACEDVIANITTPDPNCSCHINWPCRDCEENAGTREVIANVKAALARPPAHNP